MKIFVTGSSGFIELGNIFKTSNDDFADGYKIVKYTLTPDGKIPDFIFSDNAKETEVFGSGHGSLHGLFSIEDTTRPSPQDNVMIGIASAGADISTALHVFKDNAELVEYLTKISTDENGVQLWKQPTGELDNTGLPLMIDFVPSDAANRLWNDLTMINTHFGFDTEMDDNRVNYDPINWEEAGFNPPPQDAVVTQALETYYNDNTEQSVTVLTGGYSPPSGWVKGKTLEDTKDFYGSHLNETIIGNASDNKIYGSGGNNTLTGGLGADTFYVTSNDMITDLTTGDTLIVSDLAVATTGEVLNFVATDATVNQGEVIITTSRNESSHIDLGAASAGVYTIAGGFGEDNLTGSPGLDTIVGGGGHDIINGGDGDDYIWGMEGDDTLTGGSGACTI